MKYIKTSVIVLAAVTAASPAFAHNLATGAGFAGGFSHPFLGWDHMLAMTGFGLWLGVSGGKPLAGIITFVAALAAGFILGATGVHVPLVEPGILASVLVFGLLAASAAKLPVAVAAPIIGAFAVFHGHAHGAEAPLGAGLAYAAGFMAASATIITAAFGATQLMGSAKRTVVVQRLGLAIAGAGAILGLAA